MKPAVLLACLLTMPLFGCSWIPRAGPSASEVIEQGRTGGEILFDVVEVDDRVVSTLLAQPKESFQVHFKKDAQPPDVKIAVGDTISVLIWESAAGGLFSDAPLATPSTGSRPATEPLAPESRPPTGQRPNGSNAPSPSIRQPPGAAQPAEGRQREGNPAREAFSIAADAASNDRRAAQIPEQQVGADGAISVPYAGRIPAAGRSPEEVQRIIETRLAQKALDPQALVIVKKSSVNAVTVAGEMISGARVPLSPGGERLLEIVAAAGGAKAPVHEAFVRLSRNGVTAAIPLEQLVSDPAENIYAQPGDVLTLVRVPQTFSVFGATGRNAEIAFDAQKISLSEALGKSQGLRDDLAKPEGVFLFRYEPNSVVRALDQPIAAGAQTDVSPVVYRFNLRDGEAYFLARQFPVRDKDVIFVADAPVAQMYKFFTALNQVTGPIVTGLVTCHYVKC
jgi:polysaccharide export outer membrane protein